jgi:exopolyphosphatase/guanosine-5'-triphosphate,3'-diphosphate pyrophosphatase
MLEMLEMLGLESLAVPSSYPIQFAPLSESEGTSPVLVPYAAYDIGSGGTKFMGALVNAETLKIEEIFSQGSSLVGYQADLNQSPNHEFSDVIQEMGLNALLQAKTKIEQDFHVMANFQQYGKIHHFGVATAAFRTAINGETVAHSFTDKLDIPINIVSQDQEGMLAYYGAVSKIDSHIISDDPVVWDIGGGSMQFTYKDVSDHFHVLKGQLASQTFYSLATSNFSNPMNESDVTAAIELAKAHLGLNTEMKAYVQHKIDNGIPIVAVGSVHNFSVQPLCNLAGTHPETNYYTKDDLRHAITLLTDKTNEEIYNISKVSNFNLAKEQLTNLVLVYATMDSMGIEKVHTIKTSNIEGVLTLPEFGVVA